MVATALKKEPWFSLPHFLAHSPKHAYCPLKNVQNSDPTIQLNDFSQPHCQSPFHSKDLNIFFALSSKQLLELNFQEIGVEKKTLP